jgi:hypothetical protein
MENSAPLSHDPTSDEYSSLIRRHAHDVRNGLNGFEIEASLLEVIHGDDKTHACLHRMRNQGAAIELALRFLLNRFAEPQLELVPAVDVFHLWRSRAKRLAHFETIHWSGEVGDALVSVDAGMVADALCEGLSYTRGSSIGASVGARSDEVVFEIRQTPDSSGKTLAAVSEWPLLDRLVAQNGGLHEVASDPEGALVRLFRFPRGTSVWA